MEKTKLKSTMEKQDKFPVSNMITPLTVSAAQERVFAWAKKKGWCEREVPIPEQVALIHSEASEALEAWRNKEPLSWTDENNKPQGVGSEYADIVIRVLHYCALNNIDLEYELKRKMDYNDTRAHRHGNKAG
jgi:NTP pyrophosphatase (non-canonical NTP hydrolase)